jgi:hypothetical protein
MINILCTIETNVLGRWIITDYDEPSLAWSGSRWVPHDKGIPIGDIQVCNYESKEEAWLEAETAGLVVVI